MAAREDESRLPMAAGPARAGPAAVRPGTAPIGDDSLRTLLEQVPDALIILSGDCTIRHVAPGVEAILGYRPADLVGRIALDLLHPDDAAAVPQTDWLAGVVPAPGGVTRVRCRVADRHGSWRPLECSLRNCLGTPAVAGVIASIRPADRCGRLHDRIRRYRRRLRDLAGELTLSEERQRQRLAADLHDDLAQRLMLAKMRLDALLSDAPPENLGTALAPVADLIAAATQTTRALALDLSPPVLHDADLTAALRWLAGQIEGEYGLKVRTEDDGHAEALPLELRVMLYRAARELLINVAKHAGAAEALVTLGHRGGEVRVTVVDQGVGFDLADLPLGSARDGGMGIIGVRRRLACFGGRLEVRSAPGRGTRMTLIASSGPPARHG